MITRILKAGHPDPVAHNPHLPRFAFPGNSLGSYLVLMVGSTILSLAAVILVTRVGAVLTATMANPDNPFAPYTAIMPGHSSAELDEHNCRSIFDRNSTPPCSIVPDGDPFHLISVTRRGELITELMDNRKRNRLKYNRDYGKETISTDG